jgi:phosphoglycolate phosphatase
MSRPVIFDLDGTLADTLADLAAAANHALSALSYPPVAEATYRQLVGEGLDRLLMRALNGGRDVAAPDGEAAASHDAAAGAGSVAALPVDEARRLFLDYYAAHSCDHTTLYPGIAALLDALVQRGVPLAVLSNKPDSATRAMVGELLGRWRFEAVRGQRDDTPRKPDPAGALAIASSLRCPPHQCVYLGDSRVDMQTAQSAGMLAVGAAWGFRGPDELREAGADAIIGQPEELLAYLNRPPV